MINYKKLINKYKFIMYLKINFIKITLFKQNQKIKYIQENDDIIIKINDIFYLLSK